LFWQQKTRDLIDTPADISPDKLSYKTSIPPLSQQSQNLVGRKSEAPSATFGEVPPAVPVTIKMADYAILIRPMLLTHRSRHCEERSDEAIQKRAKSPHNETKNRRPTTRHAGAGRHPRLPLTFPRSATSRATS
jgi:hypothetical protein